MLAGATEMVVARRRAVAGRRDLGHAHAEHGAGGAGGARADADQQALDAGVHQLQGGRVVDAVADHDRDAQLRGQLAKGELLVAAADMARGEHRPLDHQAVGTGLLDDPGAAG